MFRGVDTAKNRLAFAKAYRDLLSMRTTPVSTDIPAGE